jgi:hypothetical protein
MSALHIGLDLDNTIIDYGSVFAEAAVEMRLVPSSSFKCGKDEIKAQLLRGPGEEAWMAVQGQVYGRFIDRAVPYSGFDRFLMTSRQRGHRISIVSHKTRYGHFDPAQVDLWEAARAWLKRRKFFAPAGYGLMPDDVHFLETREAKVACIAALGCDMFVDDLPDVLLHPAFPPSTERIWFARDKSAVEGAGLLPHRSWDEITERAFRIA